VANFLASFTLSSERDNYANYVGIQFVAGAPGINVTQFGIRKGAGGTGVHTVYLVDQTASNTIVASLGINITSANAGQFVYGALSSSINLTQGHLYNLVTIGDSGGGQNWAESSPVTLASGFTCPQSIYGPTTPNGAYTISVANQCYYGLDMVFTVSAAYSNFLVNYASAGTANSFTGFIGGQFVYSRGSPTVTQLGVRWQTGDTSKTVYLIDTVTQTTIAQTTISLTGGTVGSYYYGSVTPVNLVLGRTYMLVAGLVTSSDGQTWDVGSSTATISPAFTSLISCYSSNANPNVVSAYTLYTAGCIYHGLDMVFTMPAPIDRVSTFYREALTSGSGSNRISTLYNEIIASGGAGSGSNRVSAVYNEVIIPSSSTPPDFRAISDGTISESGLASPGYTPPLPQSSTAVNRISTAYAEVVADGRGAAVNRVSTAYIEVVASGQPINRVSTAYLEVVGDQAPTGTTPPFVPPGQGNGNGNKGSHGSGNKGQDKKVAFQSVWTRPLATDKLAKVRRDLIAPLVGPIILGAAGAAAGQAAVVGGTIVTLPAAGAAAGQAAVAGVGLAVYSATGAVVAGAVVTAAGPGIASAAGQATGQAAVLGVPPGAGGIVAGAGTAAGAATVAGVPVQFATAAGLAEGQAGVAGVGSALIAPLQFPVLPGMGWPVHRRPNWRTIISPHPSGGEDRSRLWQYPLWEFELTFDGLTTSASLQSQLANLAPQSLQTLLGFYLVAGGQQLPFIFRDPDFNAQVAGPVGTGDGSSIVFQFFRMVNGAKEPASLVTGTPTVYFNGVAQALGSYVIIYPNNLVFYTAPPLGTIITADFNYEFLCRFIDDGEDFQQLILSIFELTTLKFRQIRTS
jgi:hypothetical protein